MNDFRMAASPLACRADNTSVRALMNRSTRARGGSVSHGRRMLRVMMLSQRHRCQNAHHELRSCGHSSGFTLPRRRVVTVYSFPAFQTATQWRPLLRRSRRCRSTLWPCESAVDGCAPQARRSTPERGSAIAEAALGARAPHGCPPGGIPRRDVSGAAEVRVAVNEALRARSPAARIRRCRRSPQSS